MINNICTYTGNTIFTSEMIETIPAVEDAIVGSDGVINRVKVTALRIAIWTVSVVISCYSDNIIGVLNFTGSFFTPIVSYFGPLYYSWAFHWSRKKEASQTKKYHDIVYLAIAVLYSLTGMVDLFKQPIE